MAGADALVRRDDKVKPAKVTGGSSKASAFPKT